eukprot:scaffold178_cov255-Pinguiococcus_pyrenoidosus.AAC.1
MSYRLSRLLLALWVLLVPWRAGVEAFVPRPPLVISGRSSPHVFNAAKDENVKKTGAAQHLLSLEKAWKLPSRQRYRESEDSFKMAPRSFSPAFDFCA